MGATRVTVTAVPGRGAKTYLVRGERTILIDTGNKGDAPRILAAIEASGARPEEVSLIVITHCHGDHTSNLAALKARTGAQVAVHRLEVDLLARGENAVVAGTSAVTRALIGLARMAGAGPGRGVEAEVVIDDELDLAEHGVAGARVVHTPGHTPGSVSVLVAGGEAIVGDLVFGLGTLRVLQPPIASDLAAIRTSVRRVLEARPTIIHPTHGGPFAPERVRRALG
jgi:glyoxylase-like metal-dependent hydrolase (beta-lactamase superfamily II)